MIRDPSRSHSPALMAVMTHTSSDFCIKHDAQIMVSRNHCEVYAIVYEPSASFHVYVRDRKSINGTYVNGKLIGAGPQWSSGYLLDDGDVIEIRPHWHFTFNQAIPVLRHELTRIQQEECQVRRPAGGWKFGGATDLFHRCSSIVTS